MLMMVSSSVVISLTKPINPKASARLGSSCKNPSRDAPTVLLDLEGSLSNSPLDFSTFAYLGLFAINQFCFTLGHRYTNVTHSSIIVGLAPFYTLTLAV